MTRRTPISPKVRWTVLARDGYRCRYCGDAPPNCVLVVDHWYPASRGGTSNPDNLITACEMCNQGKSDSVCPHVFTVQECQEVSDKVVAWLAAAWRVEANVDWQPDDEMLFRALIQAPSYAEAESWIRAVAARVRDGLLSPERYTFAQIMTVIDLYLGEIQEEPYWIARSGGPIPDYLDQFWERIHLVLE